MICIGIIQIDFIEVIRVGAGVIWINVIQNDRIFAPNLFQNKESWFWAQHFRKCFCLHGFQINFLLHRVMRWSCERNLVLLCQRGNSPYVSCWDSITAIPTDIYIPPNSSTTLCTGNLWHYSPDSSWWVHRNSVTCVLTKINTHFVTTFTKIPKEKFRSPCPRLSMEALAWLMWMSILSERALLIARFSDPIVIADNPSE